MTTGWKTSAKLGALLLVAAGFVIGPPALAERPSPQAPAQNPNVTVDPALLSGVSFRNLNVFSRGGRVTAVTGVPANQQLYYMGSTGGGVWRTDGRRRDLDEHLRRLLRGRVHRRD